MEELSSLHNLLGTCWNSCLGLCVLPIALTHPCEVRCGLWAFLAQGWCCLVIWEWLSSLTSLDSPFGHCLGRISISFSLLREWASVVRPLAQLVLLDEYVDGWGICELPNTSWAVFGVEVELETTSQSLYSVVSFSLSLHLHMDCLSHVALRWLAWGWRSSLVIGWV